MMPDEANSESNDTRAPAKPGPAPRSATAETVTLDDSPPIPPTAEAATAPAAGPTRTPPPPPAALAAALNTGAFLRASWNPLLAASAPLLDLAGRLRDLPEHANPERLRDRVIAEIRRFESAATTAGSVPEEVRIARFALCACLDDVVLATPWGPRSVWAREGLVAAVEKATGAAERFFDLLDAMLGEPHLHRRELELYYVCLSLGFEGKYRDRPRGMHDLNHRRDALYRVLRRERNQGDRALSPLWRGSNRRFRPPGMVVPPWVMGAVTSAALVILFMGLSQTLTEKADGVAARLIGLLPDRPLEIARLAPPPAGASPVLAARIMRALEPEVRSDAVSILAGEDGALVVRVQGGIFKTGSDSMNARFRAVMERVGQVLADENGHIVVVAHGDDQHSRTVRFPTVQSLTEAQAEAVRQILARRIAPERLSAEGRGDAEPVSTEPTPAGRQANRRVDIRLYPQ